MLKKIFALSVKQTQKKPKKKRIFSTPNFFFPDKKSKTPSFYQKLYSITPDSSNCSKKENIDTQKTSKKKSISLKRIFKKPKLIKTTCQFRKITNPKLPFSKRTIEPKEVLKNRIKLSKPSKIFHDFDTIQWLRKKFSENIINKSIYTLLPNNGKPVIPEDETEEDKRHRKMIEYLESLKGPIGREKYININPKYFFNRTTFETILKLKKIFLDFDADGNRRMELDEMLEMFESNKISANINDLVNLFFRGKKFKEKEVMKLYLNFHQFMNFALTREQDFRQFMRKIKERADKKKKYKNKNGMSNEDTNSDNEKDGYLPMSFKSLLDYFVDKGKERDSKTIINKAIEEMNEIINKTKSNKNNTNNSLNTSKKFNSQKTIKLNENDSSKSIPMTKKKSLVAQKTMPPSLFKSIIKDAKHVKHINKTIKKVNKYEEDNLEKYNLDLNLEEDLDIDYEKQLKDIDFKKIIEEFSHLFNINQISSFNQNNNVNDSNNNKNDTNIKSPNKKESENSNKEEQNQKEKQNKKEKEKEKEKEKDKDDKKTIIKKYSQSLLNSVSTRSQENIRNYLTSTTKGDYSNTFYNPHYHIKGEFPKKKEYKIIYKKNKLLSADYYDLSRPGLNNTYKNNYIKNINNSRNQKNLNKRELNNKNYYKLKNDNKDYISKSQNELPNVYKAIYDSKLKSNTGNSFYDFNHNNKKILLNRNINIIPITQNIKTNIKFNFLNKGFNSQNNMNKFYINFYGGKLNLIKKHNSFYSRSKLDYVPLKLLSNPTKYKRRNEIK